MIPYLGVLDSINDTYRIIMSSNISPENCFLLANLFELWHAATEISLEITKTVILRGKNLSLDVCKFAIREAVKLYDSSTEHKNAVATIADILVQKSVSDDVNVLWECVTEISNMDRFDDECFALALRLLYQSLTHSLKTQKSIDPLAFEFCFLQALSYQGKRPDVNSIRLFLNIIVNTLKLDTFENRWKVHKTQVSLTNEELAIDYNAYFTNVEGSLKVLYNCAKQMAEYSPLEALSLSEFCLALLIKRPVPEHQLEIQDLSIPPSVLDVKCPCEHCTKIKKFLVSQESHISLSVSSHQQLLHLITNVWKTRERNRSTDPILCRFAKKTNGSTYDITKNYERLENEMLHREREALNMYMNDAYEVMYTFMLSAVKLDLNGVKDVSHVQTVLNYISEYAMKHALVATKVISFLRSQNDQGYQRFADGLAQAISRMEYENANKLPIAVRYTLADIARSCGQSFIAVKYLTDIFKDDPSMNCLLQLKVAYLRDTEVRHFLILIYMICRILV
jgi:hypothetical protein